MCNHNAIVCVQLKIDFLYLPTIACLKSSTDSYIGTNITNNNKLNKDK